MDSTLRRPESANTSSDAGPARARRGPATVVVIAAAVLAAVAVYRGGIKGNLSPKNFGVVDQGLVYRSGQLTPSAMRMVKDKYHIKTVIDLGSYEPDQRGEQRNQQVADALGITRYVMDLEGDSTGNPNYYVQALRLMTDPANQPVLVHCGAGSERSGCAVVLYNAIKHGTPLDEGLKDAEKFKHNPRRNPKLAQTIKTWAEPIMNAYRSGGPVAGAEPLPDPRPNPHAGAAPAAGPRGK